MKHEIQLWDHAGQTLATVNKDALLIIKAAYIVE